MRHSVKKMPLFFIFVTFLFYMFFFPVSCYGQDINVNLVWKFKDSGWIQVQVEQGLYYLSKGLKNQQFPKGSFLQLGWGGNAPVLKVNYSDFEIYRDKVIQVKSSGPDGVFKIVTPEGNSVSYGGSLEIVWLGDRWQLINQIEGEEYLKGVVPIEMSSSWAKDGFEALKAQAVAARTFMVKHTQGGKTITDSPDIHQAYLGKDVEGVASRTVELTNGQILVDHKTNQPIDVFYSAHNGGFSELTNNVWTNYDKHYSSRRDKFSDGVGGAADRWRFIISSETLGKTFKLGPIKEIELDKYLSGRVKNVKLVDFRGESKVIAGRKFVQAYYPFGQPISKFAFLGSLFIVDYYPGEVNSFRQKLGVPFRIRSYENNELLPGPRLDRIISSSQGISEEANNYGSFIFSGRGWGHGVGMSQWGAYHMAQLGYTYEEILMYYYDNTLLRKQ